MSRRITIIGVGTIGKMLTRCLKQESNLTLCSRDHEKGSLFAKEEGVQYQVDLQLAIQNADLIMIAVKPKDIKQLSFLRFRKDQIVVSVLAGVEIQAIQGLFEHQTVLRMMPNLAVRCSSGIIGFCGDASYKNILENLFKKTGLICWIDESQMDAFAAIAASSPAFAFLIIEAMIEGGILIGFSKTQSKEIVMQVFKGVLALLEVDSPSNLKQEITSPAGTTIEGIVTLEDRGVRGALMRAIEATYLKKPRR